MMVYIHVIARGNNRVITVHNTHVLYTCSLYLMLLLVFDGGDEFIIVGGACGVVGEAPNVSLSSVKEAGSIPSHSGRGEEGGVANTSEHKKCIKAENYYN